MRPNDHTNDHPFPAGKYWIGDPCYAVKDENWDRLIVTTGYMMGDFEEFESLPMNERNFNDGLFIYNGRVGFVHGTLHGDGTYHDQHGNTYGVDTGQLSIMPFEVCDGDYLSGGQVFDFLEPFTVSYHEGIFTFGEYLIDTQIMGFIEEEED